MKTIVLFESNLIRGSYLGWGSCDLFYSVTPCLLDEDNTSSIILMEVFFNVNENIFVDFTYWLLRPQFWNLLNWKKNVVFSPWSMRIKFERGNNVIFIGSLIRLQCYYWNTICKKRTILPNKTHIGFLTTPLKWKFFPRRLVSIWEQ